ncbi:hypothetical protein [Pseudoduganella lutea]|uniref:Uncharacterized protein n=1 Tax=Pseudoduganella lutea TaxID=321985 RepID=A0A4P6L1Z8_9BURK|nr:hypothetical protein [Pseudoduganella lutea]QBE65255.1 hypothetical protein EWM63_21515 [Pseudoduganella lutea]
MLQAAGGEVTIREAQNCVISAARVTIGEATNCEIVADEVVIGIASGCAIAGRNMAITVAGPRKGSEMLLFALVPDTRDDDEAITDLAARAASCRATVQAYSAMVHDIGSRQDVRSYLALATRVRAGEVALTAPQQALFRKMGEQLAPALNEIAQVSLAGNGARVQLNDLQGQLEKARQRRGAIAATASCAVKVIDGDTVLRTMLYHPDTGLPTRLATKDIKAHLRAGSWSHASVLQAADGAFDWSSAASHPIRQDSPDRKH